MVWFASPKTPAAYEAFRMCEVLDLKMAHTHTQLAAAAQVLDEDEYEAVLTKFSADLAGARAARGLFDATANDTPADGRGDHEAAYEQTAHALRAAVSTLDAAEETLQRYANAKAATEYRAGRLSNDIAHARTLISALPETDRSHWNQQLTDAQDSLHAAAEQAATRKWLRALTLVEGAGEAVAALVAGAAGAVSERTADQSGLIVVHELLAEVRATGQRAVDQLELASEFLAQEGTRVARARIISAGQCLVKLQAQAAALGTATAVKSQTAAVHADLAVLHQTLTRLAEELETVIAEGSTDTRTGAVDTTARSEPAERAAAAGHDQ